MAYETRISPEIEANPDWAAAVRRADGWAAEVVGDPKPFNLMYEWSLDRGPPGRPGFLL